MEFPDYVLDIVRKATEDNKGDIDKAVEVAEAKIRKLKDYDKIVSKLIHNGIRGLVHDFRHSANTRMRKQAGDYTKPPKVQEGTCKAVNKAIESHYDYYIAGTTLGEVFGEDLPRIVDSERAIGEGHFFNVRLGEALISAKVPETKRVKQVISNRRLNQIWQSCKT